MDRRRVLRTAASAAALTLAVATLGFAACTQKGHHQRGDEDRAANGERQRMIARDPQRGRGAGPPVRIQIAEDLRFEPSVQAELADAARRFATTIAGRLYGPRRAIDVEPVAPELRRELARAPPYVPEGQIGSGEGEAVRVEVFAQTARSGVLAVVLRDSRTNYPIRASFERRAGRWLIAHLNRH